MRTWSSSYRTPRSWPARHASFHTAVRGSLRRRSPPASPYASCRSRATSSTSPDASSCNDAGVRLHHKRLNPRDSARRPRRDSQTPRRRTHRPSIRERRRPVCGCDGGRRTADRNGRQFPRWPWGCRSKTCSAVTIAKLWRRGQVGWPRRFPIAQFPNPPLLLALAGWGSPPWLVPPPTTLAARSSSSASAYGPGRSSYVGSTGSAGSSGSGLSPGLSPA